VHPDQPAAAGPAHAQGRGPRRHPVNSRARPHPRCAGCSNHRRPLGGVSPKCRQVTSRTQHHAEQRCSSSRHEGISGLCAVRAASSSYAASAGLGPAPQARHRPGSARAALCSSSVADPRLQNAAAKSQTAIPALMTPCGQLSVGLEQQWPPTWNH
jgi:hypothetical protein